MEREQRLQQYHQDTVYAEYAGELSCEIAHIRSESWMRSDAPVDNQGLGRSFSPTDMLAASFISCMLTIMGIRARNEDWNLDGTAIACKKVMADSPRRVTALHLTIKWGTTLDKTQKATLMKVAMACPVAKSLSESIKVTCVEYS